MKVHGCAHIVGHTHQKGENTKTNPRKRKKRETERKHRNIDKHGLLQ